MNSSSFNIVELEEHYFPSNEHQNTTLEPSKMLKRPSITSSPTPFFVPQKRHHTINAKM